ncbi:MAG: SpaH/EbpB family LPXTG-anchored major pilin [Lachnospiraceae bacterium]
MPTVTKEVFNEATGTTESNKWQDRNFANIGDTVKFQTTITTKKGAENYILHDKMDEGFTLINDSIKVKHGNTEYAKGTDYDVTFGDKKGTDENACTFHITFKEQFYKNLAVDTKVVVTYEAVLNEKAFIGHNEDNSGNKNATWLSYGDSKNTIESKTNTYTYQIPVFKYTEKNGSSFGLANAKFTLSTDENGTNKIKFVQEAAQDGYDIYRVAKKGETNTIDTIVTGENGKFKIKGIHGEFYLTEIEAPKGYNKLAKPKLIKVSELSIIFVDGTMNSGDVKILNQSGSLLPSTGGMGTTIFYIAGAFLVLISGVVLIAKKRTDSK